MEYDNRYSNDDLDNQYYDDSDVTKNKNSKFYSTKNVKCIDAIVEAFERMQTLLFSPFDFNKWFFMGFTAWLMMMFDGGGINFNYNFSNFSPSGRGGSLIPGNWEQGVSQIQDYLSSISSTSGLLVELLF
jgi:hypothetical protein